MPRNDRNDRNPKTLHRHHWTDLPRAVIAARDKAQQEARAAELLATLPEEHKVILAPHPAILAAVNRAVALTIDQYRGWTNPFRPSLRRSTLICPS